MQGDVGDLGPDHNAVFIAEVIELLRVLIVGQAQGVGAQLPDDGHVRLVILNREGVALALQVLMAAHAPEGIAAAVEEEALFRIAGKHAATEAGRHLVAGGELRGCGVEIGIVHAVPEMDVFDDELGAALHRLRLPVHGDLHRIGVVPGLHGDSRGFRFEIHDRRDLDARGTFLEQFKMLLGHGDQLHFAVQAAVEGEVRLLGVDALAVAVVDGDSERSGMGQRHAEGGIAALVAGELLAVEINLRRVIGAVDFQIVFFAAQLLGGNLAHIPALASMVVVAAVLAVDGVPGMGQAHGYALRSIGRRSINGDGGF